MIRVEGDKVWRVYQCGERELICSVTEMNKSLEEVLLGGSTRLPTEDGYNPF